MLHLNALIQVGAAAGELPIIVHNNWADGDKGTHVQKVYVPAILEESCLAPLI